MSTEMEHGESKFGRGRFLRQVATTAAIGMGITLVGARGAHAQSGYCCPDTSCGPCTNSIPFRCFDSCGAGSDCCYCLTSHADCFNSACPCGGGRRALKGA